jgi:5-methylcytosine-specific restriction endonuclease McrA
MYISFILGYIYLYKISPENVRNIIEKKEFLLEFAEKSLENNEIEHSTLNNGPKLNEFKESFPVFRSQFHELVLSHYPQPDDKIPQTPKKKQSIPAEVKRQVWNTYNGVEKGQAKCFTCGVNDISQGTFEAGHVIPEFMGGVTSLENLRPICSGCNKSMATKHMATYMKNHYPLRIQQINSLAQ